MLVRHGQASFGTDDYDVLSPLGARQSRRVAEVLSGYGVSPTTLIHGGLRRQRETAEQMLRGAASWDVPLEVDERWAEIDHLGVMHAYPTLTDADREQLVSGGMDLRAFHELYTKRHRALVVRLPRRRLQGVLRRRSWRGCATPSATRPGQRASGGPPSSSPRAARSRPRARC